MGTSRILERPLSAKERAWLEAYLTCWNATEAARQAGYKWPGKVGPRKKAELADYIAAELEERAAEADEVLTRLAERARLDISPYIFTDAEGVPWLDLDALIADGHGRHIKQIKNTQYGTTVEFFDAQECLVLLGRHHKLFTDRVELEEQHGPLKVIVRYEAPDPADEETDDTDD